MPKHKIRVGITGAEGTIGSVLREALADEFDLRLFTREPQPYESTVIDLADSDSLRGRFLGLDTIVHLAADSRVDAPWDSVLQNNIQATKNVLDEMVFSNAGSIIFASTNHTQYASVMDGEIGRLKPMHRRGPKLKVTDPPAPDSLYGVSKLFGEDLCRLYHQQYGIRCALLRIGSFLSDNQAIQLLSTERAAHVRALFLSHNDFISLCRHLLRNQFACLTAYAISNNSEAFFDLSDAQQTCGWMPSESVDKLISKRI